MEAGPLNKVLFVVQARMSSTRLPGKILFSMPIGSRFTILDRVLDIAINSSYFGEIVVATSINPENQPIIDLCKHRNVKILIGEEDDVFSRFYKVVSEFSYNHVVRLTADNPLLDSELMNHVIDKHINSNFDYTKSIGLPLGMNIEVFSRTAFLSLNELQLTPNEKEHVTLAFYRRQNYRNQIVEFQSENSQIRLTVDYVEDYALASLLYSLSESENSKLGLDFIIQQKIKNPWLFEINSKLNQIMPQ
jgi:spore coat polysaccharide biosynthesis protein SpsF